MKIVTGTISHETSTFTTVKTNWDSYRKERFGYLKGNEIFDKFRNTNTAIGGFLAGAQNHGIEVVPTIFANAHPSGPTPRDIFDEILGDMLERMATMDTVDGIFLDVHGSMVVEGISDGEGHIFAAVRDLVGQSVPIIAQLDIHSNISRKMIETVDVLLGHRTYPEIDQGERARQCADIMHQILTEKLKPTLALNQLPLCWGLNQVTEHPPMKEAIAELLRIEALPEVVCASIATCYPLADHEDMGASVYIATDNDLERAQELVNELATWIWERRTQWPGSSATTLEALAEVDKNRDYPAVFADRNDNTGGGSPGDSTGQLRAFVEAGLQNACVLYMVDPEVAKICHQAGVGATVDVRLGAKSTPLQGEPIAMRAKVVAISDGHFTYHGPRYAGLDGDLGPCAHIEQNGVHVIIITEREQPFDTALCESLSLDPRAMRYLGIKSSAHFRAGFESFVSSIRVVAEPSVHSENVVEFRNLGRKIYPFDDI